MRCASCYSENGIKQTMINKKLGIAEGICENCLKGYSRKELQRIIEAGKISNKLAVIRQIMRIRKAKTGLVSAYRSPRLSKEVLAASASKALKI